ncbi:hypothetical protein G6F60_005641 [Rhizopus arrhizus]|nr:hypothetical protein G6F61_003082 [Rhizopus arrhizus]KAG1402543.1 hypothetical protein G6F60_005641 [Rhizopus arrhizus]
MSMNERAKAIEDSILSYHGISDSEDDFSSTFGNDNDTLDNYNVSDKLKNLLRLGNFQLDDNLAGLDDESEDDSVLNPIREAEKRIPIEAGSGENKYMNFPLKPPAEEDKTAEKKKQTKKPKVNKMKRREKEKRKKSKADLEIDDILEHSPRQRRDIHEFLERLRQEDSDNEEGDRQIKKPKRNRVGRRTRKKTFEDISSLVDENGERLVRTTELLDTSSDDSEDDRPMTKKEELEMYRERERMLRATEVKIKPTIKVKTFEDFIKRREQREQEEKAKREKEKALKQLQQVQEESSDSDLEIIYDKKLYPTSPERSRNTKLAASPIRNGDTSRRNFNAVLLKRIYEQTHEHRKNIEEAAKARGNYISAADRAKRLIEQEKKAQLINQQIEQHFNRKPKSLFSSTDNDIDMLENEDEGEEQEEEEEEEEEEEKEEEKETMEEVEKTDNNEN